MFSANDNCALIGEKGKRRRETITNYEIWNYCLCDFLHVK